MGLAMQLYEQRKGQVIEEKLEAFFKNRQYKQLFDALQDSPLADSRRGIMESDYYVLGEMYDKYNDYKNFCEANGNISDLGVLPQLALDIITSSFAASIIPYVCTVQNIEEERGLVYYKNVVANIDRGNVTKDQKIISALKAPDVYPVGYAGEELSEPLFTTVATQLTYEGIVSVLPLRPKTLFITVPDLAIEAVDDAKGNIYGKGLWGTIDYNTGDFSITFYADPGNAHVCSITYSTDFEQSGNIPKVTMQLDSTDIRAQIFVVGSDTGLFKAYSMNKRFGKRAEDEVVNDLTEGITAEVGNTIIQKIETFTPPSNAEWNRTPPDGVSWQDHRFELIQRINEAEAQIFSQLGKGVVNTIIAGAKACSVLASLPNFEKSGLDGVGAHLYGTLDKKINILRAPQLSNSYKMYLMYKGTGYFDAPVAYAPYMPLFVTGTIPSPDNILKKAGLAAIWAGLKVVVPNMITDLTIIQT